MTRDDERFQRASQPPIVGGLPDIPGIGAAMGLSPGLGVHLRGLADALLVDDFPGATLRRAEREMIAVAVSAWNRCYYCLVAHGAAVRKLSEDPQLGEMLAQGRLAEAHGRLKGADGSFALDQLAQDQQALGIGHQRQAACHMIGLFLKRYHGAACLHLHYIRFALYSNC